uniref:Uncharacterized protein n=1 Tax=Wuchereria bancrofti TaxID=6293 RepID=A0AAF5PU86_WUCBA
MKCILCSLYSLINYTFWTRILYFPTFNL